jgi:hypothetical protein
MYVKMAREAMIILQPFISIFIVFDDNMVHNMLTIMLNPRYMGMQCIKEHIGL